MRKTYSSQVQSMIREMLKSMQFRYRILPHCFVVSDGLFFLCSSSSNICFVVHYFGVFIRVKRFRIDNKFIVNYFICVSQFSVYCLPFKVYGLDVNMVDSCSRLHEYICCAHVNYMGVDVYFIIKFNAGRWLTMI